MSKASVGITQEVLCARLMSNLTRAGLLALTLLLISLAFCMAGYHWLAPMSWMDAFENAAMLLGGMGPVATLDNANAKLFAGLYAMYCGVVFIATAGLLTVPVAHHVLHRFHLDEKAK